MAFRSLVYLASFGAIGYVLLKVTEPSEDKIKEINRSNTDFMSDEKRKNALIVEKLKEATYGSNSALLTKSQQEQQQQPTKREIN